MEIAGKKVLILGGAGLVGMAVARELLPFAPVELVIAGLTRREAEQGVAELHQEQLLQPGTELVPEWGDLFVPAALKDRSRAEIVADQAARTLLLDHLLGELTDDVVRHSWLGSLLLRRRPDIIVDCVNTATAFAYQNIFQSAAGLRSAAASGQVSAEAVERHLATLYLPQLIRHVQIALDAMRRAGTSCYLKVGTAGTGGMGLNIPFTHSEERPSRMLLAKSGVAGAHTLLLYLMARTPGAPAVKEIKPTAAISWKRIGVGEVLRGGRPIPCFDSVPQPLAEAFSSPPPAHGTGSNLQGVYVDAGENGWFTSGEFETLTALGLMEFITPEEIAADVVREIRGFATGRDVVAALDAATSGPTYRAGVLREAALERMDELERLHGVRPVAYEMLGPPRLSKLLFEGELLARLFPDLHAAERLDAEDTASRAEALLLDDTDLRVRALSIGIPILLRDGARLVRGPEVRVPPAKGQSPADQRLAENGWVDLRPANWRRWKERLNVMVRELDSRAEADAGSRLDIEPGSRRYHLRPGRLAAWVFRHEDRGSRIKR